MSGAKLLNVAVAVLVATMAALSSYVLIYEPLVRGRWLYVLTLLAASVFWAALRGAARRKADSIDYRRH